MTPPIDAFRAWFVTNIVAVAALALLALCLIDEELPRRSNTDHGSPDARSSRDRGFASGLALHAATFGHDQLDRDCRSAT